MHRSERWIEITEFHVKSALNQYVHSMRLIPEDENVVSVDWDGTGYNLLIEKEEVSN